MTKYPMTKEIRMSKSEVRRVDGYSRALSTRGTFVTRISSFLRHWVFRHSSFCVCAPPTKYVKSELLVPING